MRRKIRRLLRIALGDLSAKDKKSAVPSAFDAVSANAKRRVETHLSDERDKLSEMGRLLVRIDLENLADAVIMVPLLKKLLFVACWVPLDEVL